MLVSLEEDDVKMFGVAILKLLLKKATTMLILAQRIDLSSQTLQGDICESIGYNRVSRPQPKRYHRCTDLHHPRNASAAPDELRCFEPPLDRRTSDIEGTAAELG